MPTNFLQLAQTLPKIFLLTLFSTLALLNYSQTADCNIVQALFGITPIAPAAFGNEAKWACPLNSTSRQTCCSDADYKRIGQFWNGTNAAPLPTGSTFKSLNDTLKLIKINYDWMDKILDKTIQINVNANATQTTFNTPVCEAARNVIVNNGIFSDNRLKRAYNQNAELCAKREVELKKGFLCSMCDVDSQKYYIIDDVMPANNKIQLQTQACDWIVGDCAGLYADTTLAILPYVNAAYKLAQCLQFPGVDPVSPIQFTTSTDWPFTEYKKCFVSTKCQALCTDSTWQIGPNPILWLDAAKLTTMSTLINGVFSGAIPVAVVPLPNRVLDAPMEQNTFERYLMQKPAEKKCEDNDTSCMMNLLKKDFAENLDLKNSQHDLNQKRFEEPKAERTLPASAALQAYINTNLDKATKLTVGAVNTHVISRAWVVFDETTWTTPGAQIYDLGLDSNFTGFKWTDITGKSFIVVYAMGFLWSLLINFL